MSILQVQNVSKHFGKLVAVNGVTLNVEPGELRAVAFHLAGSGVEQESANRRTSDVDTDDKGVRAHGEFPL